MMLLAKDVNFGGFSANEVSCYGKYVVVISDSGKFLFGELEDGHGRKYDDSLHLTEILLMRFDNQRLLKIKGRRTPCW